MKTTDRFVQVRVGHDFVFDRLRRVNAPDPPAAYGLLMQLVFLAEWREPGRGTVKTTILGLAEHVGTGRGRVHRLMESLEAADLIRCDFVRGHEGEVLVLAYDELVHFSQARPPTSGRQSAQVVSTPMDMASTPMDMASTPMDMASTPMDIRPAETAPRTKKVELHKEEDSAKSFERETPADPLKRQCVETYAKWGIARDDCVRIIDRLRCYGDRGIADSVISEAIGLAAAQGENDPGKRSLGYLYGTAVGQYQRATNQGPS